MSDKKVPGTIEKEITRLASLIQGEIFQDASTRIIYSTDASAYRELPFMVITPQTAVDIPYIIEFARRNHFTIIPRTAGTSLAGQVVGDGIIVDCSKHMNRIIELNADQKWVRVEPGVVLDELNLYLKQYGLFFGPETSTSNRCMIGGMVGNNACGAHSLVYGSTRDHTLEIKGFASDGSELIIKDLNNNGFEEKCKFENLEGEIYRNIRSILNNPENRIRIVSEYPDPAIKRRNTGYAIDLLMNSSAFIDSNESFNFSKIICGSEGTLMFITEIKLNLLEIQPLETGLLVIHHADVNEAFEANLIALKYKPIAIELIDHVILDCTRRSIEHNKNRFFIQGEPQALLCVEFAKKDSEELKNSSDKLIQELEQRGMGYHYSLLFGDEISKVWALRKAGLGLLSNIPGDAKPQPVIEDTAVSPEVLPDFIRDFKIILDQHKLSCVYYAHIATGELHLRPVINLKTREGVALFRIIATEMAKLVKQYKGSLSGEHGDGRLRGEFIPYMLGDENYNLLKSIKKTWDADNIFNKEKIIDTRPMDSSLRYFANQNTPEINTMFDFSDVYGMIRMAEKCNGSADCRKSSLIGGTMCPSYQATYDEDKTTRARANMLREFFNHKGVEYALNSIELYKILDLCLSCKGCKSECPSGVDMAKLKSEFLYQYHLKHRVPLRTWIIAHVSMLQKTAYHFSSLYNKIITTRWIANSLKSRIGFNKNRTLPRIENVSFRAWIKKHVTSLNNSLAQSIGTVYLFVDEFIDLNEPGIGIKTIMLLHKLNYRVTILKNSDSGRALISKGFLKEAKKLARNNVELFYDKISLHSPLIGIEPSAILCFRDEYPDLLRGKEKEKAIGVSQCTFTFEEFLYKEAIAGKINKNSFIDRKKEILFHGHCQQKAISEMHITKYILMIPNNFSAKEIKSGCCGMAGAFGYEKEHYDLSMKIGELVLFPEIRKAANEISIVASGTSCRQHIKDGTGVKAIHPAELLFDALK